MANRSVLTNRAVFVLSLAGAGVSAYLALADLRVVAMGCSALYGCATVAEDVHSWGFGIPVLHRIPTAAFGAAAYVVLAVLSFLRVAYPDWSVVRWVPRAQLVLSAGGVAISAWLTYLEAYVIQAWCQWCLTSAAIIVAIFLTTGAECLLAARAGSRSTL